jgi:hypothetical protein
MKLVSRLIPVLEFLFPFHQPNVQAHQAGNRLLIKIPITESVNNDFVISKMGHGMGEGGLCFRL